MTQVKKPIKNIRGISLRLYNPGDSKITAKGIGFSIAIKQISYFIMNNGQVDMVLITEHNRTAIFFNHKTSKYMI
tara:strand:+ start:169 stop:393 length:225 start_codon:yes stop_codon:yes gene_type:complete